MGRIAMLALIVPIYLILWVVVFGVAFIAGDRTGKRYEALCLTGILGFLGFLITAADPRVGRDGPGTRAASW
jgi:hypothetical protein